MYSSEGARAEEGKRRDCRKRIIYHRRQAYEVLERRGQPRCKKAQHGSRRALSPDEIAARSDRAHRGGRPSGPLAELLPQLAIQLVLSAEPAFSKRKSYDQLFPTHAHACVQNSLNSRL